MKMPGAKIVFLCGCLFVFLSLDPALVAAQAADGAAFALTADQLAEGKTVALDKNAAWKFKAGDEAAWAAKDFDDADWQTISETRLKPELLEASGWNGRAWLRLRVRVDDSLVGKPLALLPRQGGASEIYLDGARLVTLGGVGDGGAAVWEYNPNSLPVPIRFEAAGEHTIAVRFASRTFADTSGWLARRLLSGGVHPSFYLSVKEAGDWRRVVDGYAQATSMRVGFLFVGILLALAFLHFMLYLFYRVGRANLFYSLYAGAFGIFVFCNNLMFNGHLSGLPITVLRIVSSSAFALTFVGLLAFVYVAFERRLGKIFWVMTALWTLNLILNLVYLSNVGRLIFIPNLLIGLSFTFSIFQLVKALREKRPGAWILFTGVQLLAFGMAMNLVRQFNLFTLASDLYIISEFTIILALPIAVSMYLARNFARTNRDLQTQLAQVKQLSQQKIEQERQSAELRAENERRAKELEEARQLQISMLPKKLPVIPNLEIAAYMKPATEVGGDYYDFHVSEDGVLTVAVGDATGHGLKAGSVVTATKSLFNAFAKQNDIPQILKEMSQALKRMNLRGLFMAMTMLKIKDDVMTVSIAGMPAALVYRADTEAAEEISLRAVPLGSMTKINYQQREVALSAGDCVVLMSDGFPEMFNQSGEMLGFDKAFEVLPNIAENSAQEIINKLVKVGEQWANGRAADDDVTFVVLKIKTDAGVGSPN